MALKQNGFEAGATAGDGVGVTTGNSAATDNDAFSVVSAGASNTITYSAANKIHGAYGGLFTQGGTAASLLQLTDAAGSASFAARVYGNFLGAGFPATAASLGLQARSTADARLFSCYVDVAGKVRINGPGASGDVALGTVALTSSSTPFRLEMTATGVGTASTVVTVRLYAGEATTATDTITATVTTSGTCDRVRAGKTGTATVGNFVLDSFAVNVGSSALLGPFVVASSDYARRGGGWVPVVYTTRRSSAWV